jgi:hypothetical protein
VDHGHLKFLFFSLRLLQQRNGPKFEAKTEWEVAAIDVTRGQHEGRYEKEVTKQGLSFSCGSDGSAKLLSGEIAILEAIETFFGRKRLHWSIEKPI